MSFAEGLFKKLNSLTPSAGMNPNDWAKQNGLLSSGLFGGLLAKIGYQRGQNAPSNAGASVPSGAPSSDNAPAISTKSPLSGPMAQDAQNYNPNPYQWGRLFR